MMRSDDSASEIWGTWEDLLLACAVDRHGTRSWESIAMEVQVRSPFSDLLTPQSCRQRYLDLRRRYESGGVSDDDDIEGSSMVMPWLDELRKLRMTELRCEVERYDVSIMSLQLELKRLREEREKGAGNVEPHDKENDIKAGESPGSSPDEIAFDRISGDSGKSCKESISTDLNGKNAKPIYVHDDRRPAEAPEPDGHAASRPSREASYNGSSETLLKDTEASAAARPQKPPAGKSGDSLSGKAAVGGGEKESSDVQSSASLSRRRRGRRRQEVSGGDSVGEEAEAISPIAANGIPAESQTLISFLKIIRSCTYGTLFDRRMEDQESAGYRCIIRRHVDLEIVRARLERMGSRYKSAEFFRDLLLLCNNAIVFYPKTSPESTAAFHLRKKIVKEMAVVFPRLKQPAAVAKHPAAPRFPPKAAAKLKFDPELQSSLVACRKSSSVSANTSIRSANTDIKVAPAEMEEKPDQALMAEESDEQTLAKTQAKEGRKVSRARGLRSNKSRGAGSRAKNSKLAPEAHPSPTLEDPPAPKLEKKASAVSASAGKKRNAAIFLNRMKGNSDGNATLLDSLKSFGGKGSDNKRGGKRQGRTAAAAAQELNPATKRSVGRPPKRAAPTRSPPPVKRVKGEGASAKASPLAKRMHGRK